MEKTAVKEESKIEKKEEGVDLKVELEKKKKEKEKKGKEAGLEKKEKTEVRDGGESKQTNKTKAEKDVKPKEEKKEREETPGEVTSGKVAPLEDIISQVEKMTVLELADLVKSLEERFGVVAAAPVMAGAVSSDAPGKEVAEKTEWSVVLTAVGEKKIQVIKEVRAVTSLGLKEAKTLVEEAPKPVKEGIPQKEAEEIKVKLEAVGATAELK